MPRIASKPAAPRFKNAVAALAASDAEAVAGFLARLADGKSVAPRFLSAEFLIRLAIFLRLHEWERVGIRSHCEAGFPKAAWFLHQLVREAEADEPKSLSGPLYTCLLEVLHQTILWDTTDPAVRFRLEVRPRLDEPTLDALADLLLQLHQEST